MIPRIKRPRLSARSFPKGVKRSLGRSVGEGVRVAEGRILAFLDADHLGSLSVLKNLIIALDGCDLAVASRFLNSGGMENRLWNFSSRLFNRFLKFLGFPLSDSTSGFYALRKSDLGRLEFEKIFYGYGDYFIRLTYLAKKAGFSFKEFPVFLSKAGLR